MEQATFEISGVEEDKTEKDTYLRELNDLQLAFVGGGSGDTIAH
jgi:hypothetical protein